MRQSCEIHHYWSTGVILYMLEYVACTLLVHMGDLDYISHFRHVLSYAINYLIWCGWDYGLRFLSRHLLLIYFLNNYRFRVQLHDIILRYDEDAVTGRKSGRLHRLAFQIDVSNSLYRYFRSKYHEQMCVPLLVEHKFLVVSEKEMFKR